MGARISITFEGLEQAISRLTEIEEKAPQNLQKQTRLLAADTEKAWKSATPVRTGKLRDSDEADVSGMSFTLKNATKYYDFVDAGHWTPRGWRTRHGYRPAKRRSHVAGREMTPKALQFVEGNIEEYLAKFLDF